MTPWCRLLPAALAAGLLVLGGCDSVRRDLGLERTVPDAFRSVSQPPLTLPPEFQMRPPRPGAPARTTQAPDERAYLLLYDEAATAPSFSQTFQRQFDVSPGEQRLLAQAGADRVHPNMADILYVERTRRAVAEPALIEAIEAYTDPNPTQGDIRLLLGPGSEEAADQGGMGG